MKKEKIAISIDKPLLNIMDNKVDGSIIRSRSQAIEYYLKKGVQEQSVDTVVILLKGQHQKIALKKIKAKPLVIHQLDFLLDYGIKNMYIVTQHSKETIHLLATIEKHPLSVGIIEKNVKGNGEALFSIKEKLKNNFIAMSGDIFNNFNLTKMINKHIQLDKLATMGLMTRSNPQNYGSAIVDGDFIIEFEEKTRNPKSHIVNAGIYIFKPEVFTLFENITSLEKDLFPKLAKIKQLIGFLTYGNYFHIDS